MTYRYQPFRHESTVRGGKSWRGLWIHAPELRSTARRQRARLSAALRGDFSSYPGFRVGVGSYYPEVYVWGKDLTGPEVAHAHDAWRAGYHGGRLFALREIAYDRREVALARVRARSLMP